MANNWFKNEWVVDFETTTANTNWYKNKLKETNLEHSRPIYFYGKKVDNNLDLGGIEFEGTSHEDFAKILNTNPEIINKDNTLIWFHNLSFDGTIIVYILENIMQLKPVYWEYDKELNIFNEIGKYTNKKEKRILESGYFDIFRRGSLIYRIEARFTPKKSNRKDPITILFRCSLRMLTASVSKLGEGYNHVNFLGKPLLKMSEKEKSLGEKFYDIEPNDNLDQFKKEHKDFVEYCKRDVEIVRLSLIEFKQCINEVETIKIAFDKEKFKKWGLNPYKHSITIAGLARYLANTFFIPKFINDNKKKYGSNKPEDFLKLEYQERDFFVKALEQYNDKYNCRYYRGGFTQFNPKVNMWKNINECNDAIKIDVSSAYPFQMLFALPYGNIYDEEQFEKIKKPYWKENEDYICWKEIWVKRAVPNDNAKNCPILLNYTNLKNKKGIELRYADRTQTNFTMRVSNIEWIELQYWYKFEIEYEFSFYQLAAKFLRDFANELYEKKDYYSKNKMSGKKLSIKTLLNSLYGSLAIGDEFDNFIFVNKKDTNSIEFLDNKIDEWIDTNSVKAKSKIKPNGLSDTLTLNEYVGGKIKYDKYLNLETKGYNVSASAFITAKERVYLWKIIRKFGAQHFLYSDTDSIIFHNLTPTKRQEIEAFCESHKPNPDNDLGSLEVEIRYIIGFNTTKAKQYLTRYLAYDEKAKQFYKIINNQKVYCKKEEADIYDEVKSGGFDNKNTELKEWLSLTQNQIFNMNKNDIIEYSKKVYNKELTEKEINDIANGKITIHEGGTLKKNVIGGSLIIRKNKDSTFGDI